MELMRDLNKFNLEGEKNEKSDAISDCNFGGVFDLWM